MRSRTGGWLSFPRADRPGTPPTSGTSEADEAVETLAGALVPPTPPQAELLFGSATAVAEHYARLLAGPAVTRGLIGPHEVSRLWERHLLNSAAVAELVPRPCSLVDLGSGAGLPGIVLALLLPDVAVTLLEPMLRRVRFLEECVDDLGLENAQVCRGRAEDLAGQLAADVVTARAVAPLDRLAVHRQTGVRTRIMLDVGGYRARRRTELTALGQDAAEDVSRTGVPRRLEPMTPFERKIIHDAVAAAGLRSESEGEEPNRCVVVLPVLSQPV